MAWIELHQTLPTNKKTMRLSIILNIDAVQAVGHLCFLWLWAIDNAPDGNLSNFYNGEIALVAGWKGDPDDFVNALIKSGFVNENKSLHDWYDYAGKLIEKRREDADRKRTAREKTEEIRKKSAGRPADIQRTSEINPCDGAGNTTLHNTTVPYPTVPLKNSGGGGEEQDYDIKDVYKTAWGKEPKEIEVSTLIGLMQGLHITAKDNQEGITADDVELLTISLEIAAKADKCNLAYLTGIYKKYAERGISNTDTYYGYELKTGRNK